ncbi:FAD-binding oxidoreductase [Rhodobacteraceae bacterium]|nr:FAD-binding oxidoreductase [Paracoccaceae bacterium]
MMRVVVIGGGVAGLAAGAALAPDAEVVLLERETALGFHASGRSAALFEEHYGNEAVRALNRASRRAHEILGVLSPRGLLGVALEPDVAAFEADVSALGLVEIAVADARSRVPILSDEIVRAGYFEGAWDIDTDLLMQGMAARVRQHGGTVKTGVAVKGLSRGDGWRVVCGDTEIRCDLVVNAAGAWADEIAAMAGVTRLGLQPFRRSMARLPAPGGLDVRGWPMLMGPDESWYAKPDAGGWIVSPAEEDLVEPMDVWADDMVLAEGLARYEAHVTEPVTRVETNWAGLRTFAPDRTLVIGPGDVDGFFWMAGQGGYGFQTAPAAAQLLADLVFARTPELSRDVVAALSPSRNMG